MSESEVRSEDSLQPVKYLGKIHSPYAHGIGVAIEPVRIIWKRSKKGLYYNRCAISIHSFGLCLYEEIASGTYKSVWTDDIEDISYCVSEPFHRRIFAWISRSQNSIELECHVVLCKTSQQSHILAGLLAKTFYESYHNRQKRVIELTPNFSKRCSVCDVLNRQQPNNYLHHDCHDNIEEKQVNDDYEHISFQPSTIARAFVRNYDSSSHPSSDYDATLADEDSIKSNEYYR